MWLVRRAGTGLEPDREPIPIDTAAALVRWYAGGEERADEALGVRLVQRAKTFEKWLACDCLGEEARPPLLSPAYLTEAETYYLRRLTGDTRPEHRLDCPFRRDQRFRSATEPDPAEQLPTRPEGFFAVLKPLAEHLAQRPADDVDHRAKTQRTPRLAKLLRLLLEHAELNVLHAVGNRPDPSIAAEFARIRFAAETLEIAPQVPLAPLLFTHHRAIRSGQVRAALRALEPRWPAGHQPQAFALLFAHSVSGREIHVTDEEPVVVATAIGKPRGVTPEDGPFLVLAAIGEHATARSVIPVSAWAQPVLSGRHFWPVDDPRDRALIHLLLRSQRWLDAERDVAILARRPLFAGDDAASLSDLKLQLIDRAWGAIIDLPMRVSEHCDDPQIAGHELHVARQSLDDQRGVFRHLVRSVMSAVEANRRK